MKIVSLVLILLASLFLVAEVEAKVLPQASKAKTVTSAKSAGSGINVSPRLRVDRRTLVVNFSNLQNASAVAYMLTYQTNAQDEGAMGYINFKGSTASQEILFGTCSKNVCRYHTGIKNAKLEVSYTGKNGKKYLKKYKIKV